MRLVVPGSVWPLHLIGTQGGRSPRSKQELGDLYESSAHHLLSPAVISNPWSVAIVAITILGIVILRSFPKRVRVVFDIACFAALSVALYRSGITPLFDSPISPADTSALWSRAIALTWWLLGARFAVAILYFTLDHDRRSREVRLFVDLVAAAIYVCTMLVIIKSVLVLPIGGVLATSGIVAIVLGLAMQNTLSDVFAGIAVGIEAPFTVGDRISLGNNIEGRVVEINWRSIRIQTDGADIAIVPNSVVAKQDIVNRSVPSHTRAVTVSIWCPAAADSDQVIDALLQATLLSPTILQEPPPTVWLTHFGRSHHGYTVSFSVSDTVLVQPTKSQLLLHARKQLYHAGLLTAEQTARSRGLEPLPALQVLRELILFESLDAERLDNLAKHVVTRLLEPGETLFQQGDADCTLYVVASGILEVAKARDTSDTVTLGMLGAGEYVGEIGLLTGAPHAATARARTHSCIYELSKDALTPLLSAHTEMVAAFEKSVRRGLDVLQRSVAAGASETVRDRNELLNRIRNFFFRFQ